MKPWLKRFGYLIIIILWLIVMCFPTFAFTLAMNDQIEIGRNTGTHLRFFMVTEEEASGIGMELTRPLLGQTSCRQTTVAYLLWEGRQSGQNATFCQCMDPQTGIALPAGEGGCAAN